MQRCWREIYQCGKIKITIPKLTTRPSSTTETNSTDKKNEVNRPMVFAEETISIDDPPTTCCMSGCHNCVYIAWAEALAKKMSTADPIIAKSILDNVEDPGMKVFLKMELKARGLL